MEIPFIDLKAEYRKIQVEIDDAIRGVLGSGWYILGQEVAQFEQEFAAYCEVPFAVGVASGTDAVLLALRAMGIGFGDEVITASYTAVATAAAIRLAGATPVFVDIDPVTYTLDPHGIEPAITSRTRAIVPVHLYGHPADMDAILSIAHRHKLIVVEDCAQAHGARYKGRMVGGLGDAAAFSFYPTKNLGAVGDGGAVVTRSSDVAERLRALRQYGWQQRYVSETAGYNSRLDELQAAVLRVKLRYLENGNVARRQAAQCYERLLSHLPLTLPHVRTGAQHAYHLYVVQTKHRDALQKHLAERSIGTAVQYPLPVHRQPAYQRLAPGPDALQISDRLAERVLSLPLYPGIPDPHIRAVADAVSSFFAGAPNACE
ncbi:MAG: DegT/DnrJ/EryC1/StrS family aminotransferase [Gemmatimonadota bacterium]|nr:DegT/DnrJ/EryC1/StrS family aminotransferase [Gemmatimonadota bacterium]